jgi:hypothetical protein
VVTTKKVRYLSDATVELPTLGIVVSKGDEITVDDDFANANFSDIESPKRSKATATTATTTKEEA